MNAERKTSVVSMYLRIKNSRANESMLYLEPWGEHYSMAPGTVIQVVVKGPEGDSLEIEYGDDYITLYGWTGSIASVFQDGVELGAGSFERTAVPPLPTQK